MWTQNHTALLYIWIAVSASYGGICWRIVITHPPTIPFSLTQQRYNIFGSNERNKPYVFGLSADVSLTNFAAMRQINNRMHVNEFRGSGENQRVQTRVTRQCSILSSHYPPPTFLSAAAWQLVLIAAAKTFKGYGGQSSHWRCLSKSFTSYGMFLQEIGI